MENRKGVKWGWIVAIIAVVAAAVAVIVYVLRKRAEREELSAYCADELEYDFDDCEDCDCCCDGACDAIEGETPAAE